MKAFKQSVERCNLCSAIRYIHYDGEGESSPYSYLTAVCGVSSKDLPYKLITEECKKKIGAPFYSARVPERIIPDWCELEDGK